MGEYEEASGYCTHCQKQVLIKRKGTNHILHLLLTLFTGGIWLIVWILCAVKVGGWHCSRCGIKVSRAVGK